MADMIGLLCPKKDLAQLCTLDECRCSECMTFTAGGGDSRLSFICEDFSFSRKDCPMRTVAENRRTLTAF